mgnify:CR=1 FL=1
MKAPSFWAHKGLISTLLLPLSWLYQLAGLCRLGITRPYRSSLPVICVGNITSGGTGKTPVSAYLAALARAQGLRPAILSRGYGGGLQEPTLIDPALHSAADCGDEPLLLAMNTPVIVARHRGKGAAFIEAQNRFDLIIMDDGMQNPQLHKDHIICVFDGAVGMQNKRIFPAGPLRTKPAAGQKHASLIMVNGPDKTGLQAHITGTPIINFDLEAGASIPEIDTSQPLFAFAGIGRPDRFFETLAQEGYYLVQTKAFGDHHPYQPDEITALVEGARALSALLITTEKDWVRLPKNCQDHIAYLPVSLHISEADTARLTDILNLTNPGKRAL